MGRVLLVIDMINDFTREVGSLYVPDTRRIAPALALEIEKSRASGVPVLFVCDSHSENDPEFAAWPPHAVRGTPGAGIDPLMGAVRTDYVVRKKTYSSFYRTRLSGLLKTLGADTLRITGCVTEICVFYAVLEASVRGYSLEVPAPLVAGLDPGNQEFALGQMEDVMKAKVER